jgi:glutathione S-transferase
MKLYHSPGACSMACHIALEEVGAAFEPVVLRLSEGKNREAGYLAIHPEGLVPVLELDGGQHLPEAAAILLHIARRYPVAKLLPDGGSLGEARVFEWLAWLTNTVHIAYAHLWRPERFTANQPARKTLAEEAKNHIVLFNRIIEERLEDLDFAAGSSYSVADPYLLVFFRWANRIGLDVANDLPKWTGWARRLEQRPAVARVLEREGVSLWA